MKPKIVFFGNPEFGAIILENIIKGGQKPKLVVTYPDKPVGRKQILTPTPVKIIAKKYKIPVEQPNDLKEIKGKLKKLKPDLIIIAAYGRILPKEILDIPKGGCLNIHPSLLPKYRGPSPVQFTILEGEEKTGVTIILTTEEMDKGPILASLEFKIRNPKITHLELEKELADFGAKLLLKTVPMWLEDKISPEEQDEAKKTYTKIIKKSEGRINWKEPAEKIERKIRAFNPWPSAYCKVDGKTLKIWKAFVTKQTPISPKGKIGKTYLATNDKIAVQCGKNFLTIEELQFEGKRRMKTEDFLKGNIDFIGTTLK